MKTQEILKAANRLSSQLVENGVKETYLNQLFRYLLEQKSRNGESDPKENLRKLISKMPGSGFQERGKGFKNDFIQTNQIIMNFRIQIKLLDLPLDDLRQILGWTARLMKYKEGRINNNG